MHNIKHLEIARNVNAELGEGAFYSIFCISALGFLIIPVNCQPGFISNLLRIRVPVLHAVLLYPSNLKASSSASGLLEAPGVSQAENGDKTLVQNEAKCN